MTKQTIIFRADGSSSIGMGHFTRTLALAEMLNQHFNCIFATRQPTEYQIAEIEKICHGRIDLPEDDAHFEHFLTHLKGSEIIVLDNYYFTTDYQKAIKAIGCKLVCIDDMHDKYFVSDIIINHAPLNKNLYSTAFYTKLLIGFNYALLRSSFLQEQSERNIHKKMTNAFLCIGGADINNLTSKILDELVEIIEIELITIIVGNEYQFYNKLVQKIDTYSEKKKIELFKNLNADELIYQMRLADFAVVPCSTILFEAISQKLPVLTGYYVDNQKKIAEYLCNKYKNILVLGDFNQTQIQQKNIAYLENNLEKPYSPLINRDVKDRYITEFSSLGNEFQIKCRKTILSDIDTYFLWANNESVRKNAINSDMIEYNNHVQWFNSKLNSHESFLYIFEKENTAIGQVRFDKSNKYYIIDYSVDEKFRGKGFGKTILKLGLERLQKDCLNFNYKLKALVNINNKASSSVFEKLNFLNTGIVEKERNLYFEFEK